MRCGQPTSTLNPARLLLPACLQEPAAGEPHGTIYGAVRFGEGACIGNGFWMSAHGGSIESALDEATAELVGTAGRPA